MLWGSFGLIHIISLIMVIVLNVILYYVLKYLKEPYKTGVAFIVSLSGIAAIIYNLVTWGSPLEYLPLELCSINAMILPIVVLTKNKMLGNALLLWALGALMALIMNNGMANTEVFGGPFNFYYFPHVIEFGLPIILFALGLIKFDPKYIVSTILLTMFVYTIAHIANVNLNAYFIANDIRDYAGNIVQVNYMYSVSTSGIPLLALFRSIIPYDYWCMYLVIPVIAVYFGAIYAVKMITNKAKLILRK